MVDSRDITPESIADALATLMNDSQRRAQLGQARHRSPVSHPGACR